jgi:sugar/nucleoside kinase (ribokinase family)
MKLNKINISGTGCALADFLYTNVNFNSSEFKQYLSKHTGDGGLSPGKLVFTEELEKFASKKYAEILSQIINAKSFDSFNIGGPSLVSLINASQLLNKTEYEVSYYGCTGNDQTANLISSKVQKTPLNIDNYIKLGNKPTAFTDVLSDSEYDNGNGERTFINNIGASWDYTPEMLPQSFFEADIVCFGGTALVPQIHDNLTTLLQKAKSNNCLTVVNTVFDFRNEKAFPNKKWPLVNTDTHHSLIDLLIMDCEEAIKISGKPNIDEAAMYFSQLPLAAFVITNGSKSFYAYSNGKLFNAMPVRQFPVSEAVSLALQNNTIPKGDTTGCGDNFAGGLIASLAWQLKNKPNELYNLVEAISWAVASGGFACFYVGGTYFENSENEKLNEIIKLQQLYLKQLEVLKF